MNTNTSSYNTTPEIVQEPAMFSTTFRFEWTKPPLSLNQRLHHMAKAKITAELRSTMPVTFPIWGAVRSGWCGL